MARKIGLAERAQVRPSHRHPIPSHMVGIESLVEEASEEMRDVFTIAGFLIALAWVVTVTVATGLFLGGVCP